MGRLNNWYSNGGGVYSIYGATSMFSSRGKLIEACRNAFINPTSENLKFINDAIKELAREEAKAGGGLVARDPIAGLVVGEVVDNLKLIQDFRDNNPEILQQMKDIINRSKGIYGTYDDLVKKTCASQGITNIQNKLEKPPENTFKWIDPLAIDLDGDGLEISSNSVYFDSDGDGIRNKMSWVNSDDGFLVFDKNNDGLISDGSELFGNDYIKRDGTKAVDGFDALSDLDINNDGVVDSNDIDFSSLKVWRDLNQDGITDEGELFTLTELSISSFDLGFSNSQNVGDGYEVVSSSFISYSEGNQSTFYDVNLGKDSVDTKFDHSDIEISDEIVSLMDLTGMGNVDSLQYSMVKNESLKNLIATFESYDNRQNQLSLMDSIIETWASTDNNSLSDIIIWQRGIVVATGGIDPDTGRRWSGTSVNFTDVELSPELSKKIRILSAFYGTDQFTNLQVMTENWSSVEQAINDEYERFTNKLYLFFVEQSRLDKYTNLIDVDFTSDSLFDVSVLNDYVKNQVDNWQGDLTLIEDLVLLIKSNPLSYSDDNVNLYSYLTKLLQNLEITPEIQLILDQGGMTIDESGLISNVLGVNTISLFHQSDEQIQVIRSDEVVVIGSAEDDSIYINAPNSIIKSGAGNDTIISGSGNAFFDGGEGNDSLTAYAQANNTLIGGSGDDTLSLINDSWHAGWKVYQSSTYSNTFNGGKGNDTIDGLYGTDTYIFNLGDGQDEITDLGGNDKIVFGENITKDTIQIRSNGSDIIITLLDSSGEPTPDQITLLGAYTNSSLRIETLEFSDGISWGIDEISQIINSNNITNTTNNIVNKTFMNEAVVNSMNSSKLSEPEINIYQPNPHENTEVNVVTHYYNNWLAEKFVGSEFELITDGEVIGIELPTEPVMDLMSDVANNEVDYGKLPESEINIYQPNSHENVENESIDNALQVSINELLRIELPDTGISINKEDGTIEVPPCFPQDTPENTSQANSLEFELNKLIQSYSSFDDASDDVEMGKSEYNSRHILPIVEPSL